MAPSVPPRTTLRDDPSSSVRIGWWALVLGFFAQVPLGLSVAFGYDGPLWSWHRARLAKTFWYMDDVPDIAAPIMNQLAAMLGATMTSWGFAMGCLVVGPIRRREAWAWRCVVASVGLWFVVDTYLSWRHGVWINVAFNIAALAMMGIPLSMVRPAMRG